jgi:hypothetical protein
MIAIGRVLLVSLILSSIVQCRGRSTAHTVSKDARASRVTSSAPLRATVCSIVTNPEKFYGKRVMVDGCVTTDGIEHTVLGNKECPYTGIDAAESAKLHADQRFSPKFDKNLCGTFTGVFHKSRSLGNLIVDTNVLEIEETANLRSSPLE